MTGTISSFDKVEAATADIRRQMLEVLQDTLRVQAHVENDPSRPPGDQTE